MAWILLSILLAGNGSAQQSAPDTKSQRRLIEKQLAEEKKKLESIDLQERDLLKEMRLLEAEIEKKKGGVASLQQGVSQTRRRLAALEQELPELQRKHDLYEQAMASRLAALYKYARRGYLQFLAGSPDLSELEKRTKYLKEVMAEDRVGLDRLQGKRDAQARALAAVREEASQAGKQLELEAHQIGASKAELKNRVLQLMRLHEEKQFFETAVRELDLAAREMKDTLRRFENLETSGERQFGIFADFRGRLAPPLQGRIVRTDKVLASNGVNLHKGVFIESREEVQVKAVFPGRVDFSGSLKGYGEMIIINHGSRFFTVSGHLSRRYKQAGEPVEQGEVIGLAGTAGGISESRLYFEIRKGGEILDPREWLSMR